MELQIIFDRKYTQSVGDDFWSEELTSFLCMKTGKAKFKET